MNNELWFNKNPAAGGYAIERSLRFNSADSAYLNRTPASAGNRKTFTYAAWIKRAKPGATQTFFMSAQDDSNVTRIRFESDDTLRVHHYVGNSLVGYRQTTQVFRDPSAWYHIVWAADTTSGTGADRLRLYVNGSRITQFASTTDPSQNADLFINSTNQHKISSELVGNYVDGYLADIHFIDGQALDPTSFGEFDDNGIWQPKAFAGSYGTQGWHLDFADNSSNTATTLGKDTSPNGNNWTPNNLSVTAGAGNDSLVDVPTNGAQTDTGAGGEVRGNYCTWNAVAGSGALANGNLDFSSSGNPHKRIGTIGVASSKWYFEAVCTTQASSFQGIGVGRGTFISDSGGVGGVSSSWGVLCETGGGNGYLYHNSSNAAGDIGTINVNDVMMFALDVDAGKFWVGLNGTWYNSGSPSGGTNATWTGVTGELFPVISSGSGGAMFANFGQRPFAYTAPSGFKALNTANLPTPQVTKPSDLFDVKLYTGNGSTQTISGLGFSPDFVWIKNRTRGTANHALYDIVRGRDPVLASNTTGAELTGASSSQDLTSFNSDGFSLGTVWNGDLNRSAEPYVAWAWDAGTTTTTNTVGSISSQVRANASAGFSVVTYTGNGSSAQTVGHGLNNVPSMIILKSRDDSTYQWPVWHSYYGTSTTSKLVLSRNDGTITGDGNGYVTSITSSVFGFGGGTAAVNANTQRYVAYCFAPVAGYSSFGSYTGNGSADGPFVYTGFRPRWILFKCSSSNQSGNANWRIIDTARDTYNVSVEALFPDLSLQADSNNTVADVVSNGFKVRTTSVGYNGSGATYIYAAFAEHPFQYARAR
jgi:hypothetical protein